MSEARARYYFRKTEHVLLAGDVRRLIELAENFPIRMIGPAEVAELHENHWYSHGKVILTCRSIIEHFQLIQDWGLSYPIVLDQNGRVMDGMHRVCKAVLENVAEIPFVQFTQDPELDYVNREPETLP